jgi:hypothetical protein
MKKRFLMLAVAFAATLAPVAAHAATEGQKSFTQTMAQNSSGVKCELASAKKLPNEAVESKSNSVSGSDKASSAKL